MLILAMIRWRISQAIRTIWKDQTGAQTIEWIALGILIMALMAGAAAIVSKDNTLGETIIRMIERILNRMGDGD